MCRMKTGQVSFFSVSLVLSCGVNNFVHEELFILAIFTFWGNFKQSPETPGVTSILLIFVNTISECVLYYSRYQHTKFGTCMKTAQFLPFAALLKWRIIRKTAEEAIRVTEKRTKVSIREIFRPGRRNGLICLASILTLLPTAF